MGDRSWTQLPIELLLWLSGRVASLAASLDLQPDERRAILADCRRLSGGLAHIEPTSTPMRALVDLATRPEPVSVSSVRTVIERILDVLPGPSPQRHPDWTTAAELIAQAVLIERTCGHAGSASPSVDLQSLRQLHVKSSSIRIST